MKRASLVCCSLLFAVAGALALSAGDARQAGTAPDAASIAALTVSECHVYGYLRDTVVSRLSARRMASSCGIVESRPRDS